ncbi:hypothetical protein AWENTII_003082 [Aspergillus wentii]
MEGHNRKRRCLNYEKCSFCRRDKKRCEPESREWPDERCDRCVEMGFDCSSNQRASETRDEAPGVAPPAPAQEEEHNQWRTTVLGPVLPPTWDTTASPSRVDGPAPLNTEEEEESSTVDSAPPTENDEGFQGLFDLSIRAAWIRNIAELIPSLKKVESMYVNFAQISRTQVDLSDLPVKLRHATQDLKRDILDAAKEHSENGRCHAAMAASQLLLHLDCKAPHHTFQGLSEEDLSDHALRIWKSGDVGTAIIVQETVLLQLAALANRSNNISVTPAVRQFIGIYTDLEKRAAVLPDIQAMPLPPLHRLFQLLDNHYILEAALDNVNLNRRDMHGCTALHLAAERDSSSNFLSLLRRGASLNCLNNLSYTPVQLAALCGSQRVFGGLLAHPQGVVDGSVFHYGVVNGNEDVVRLLLRQWPLYADTRCSQGRTPLSYAAGLGYLSMVIMLLDTDGVDCNFLDINGKSPLAHAAVSGHTNVVNYLLTDPDIDPNCKSIDGLSPLSHAIINGHQEAILGLLRHKKLAVDSTDINGRTALMHAVQERDQAMVELLLHKGHAHPDLRDKFGRSPLSFAAGQGLEAVVRLFLSLPGVDPSSADVNGGTPMFYALVNGHQSVAKLFPH